MDAFLYIFLYLMALQAVSWLLGLFAPPVRCFVNVVGLLALVVQPLTGTPSFVDWTPIYAIPVIVLFSVALLSLKDKLLTG